MEEHSVRVLLAEYDRLGKVYLSAREGSRHVVRLYLALVTAALAALIAFERPGTSLSSADLALPMVLLVLLCLGVLSFLWLLSLEVWQLKAFKGLCMIRQKFIDADPDIADAFLLNLDELGRRNEELASPRNVLCKASKPGDKAWIAVANCLLAGALIWYWLHSYLLAAALAGILGPSVHVMLAAWRYREQRILFRGASGCTKSESSNGTHT